MRNDALIEVSKLAQNIRAKLSEYNQPIKDQKEKERSTRLYKLLYIII